jgi:hypothetical protein
MKKQLKVFLIVAFLISIVGYVSFWLNLFGIQDCYYGSRYFRPYAELKQEPWFNQIVQMADGKILLIGPKQSEIFDPKTKRSEMVPGLDSVKAFGHYWNLLPLSNGDVLITQMDPLSYSDGDISCDKPDALVGRNPLYCPRNKTLLFNNKKKKLEWVPFRLRDLIGHTATELPDGKVLLVGGRLAPPYGKKAYLYSPPPGQGKNIVIYSPQTGRDKLIGYLIVPRKNHTTVLADKTHVLVFGGHKTVDDLFKDAMLHGDEFVTEIELIDLVTGKSKVIGKIKGGGDAIPLGNGKFLLPWCRWSHGYIESAIFDLNHPNSPIWIRGNPPENHMEANGQCVRMPNQRFICPAGKEVRELDPIHLTDRPLDQLMTPMLSHSIAIDVPKVGLLVFGHSRNLFKKVRTVQRFDYARYLRDINNNKRGLK